MKKLEAMKKHKDIKAMYNVYKTAFKGKDSFDLYVKNLSEFFRITMDIYISGYTGVPKGCGKGPKGNGEWGRADAIEYWADKCNIKYKIDNKRQDIVNSWPESINQNAAINDWGWTPEYNLLTAFNIYLIPTITTYYKSKKGDLC